MTAKTPDSPQESRPATPASSTSSMPARPPAASPAQAPRPAAARAPGRPPRKARGDGAGLAFPVAVVAVLIAIGSTIVSVYALDQARQAKSRMADSGTGRAAPTPGSTVSAAVTPAPTTPRVQFAPEIVRGSLRIPPADGCASVFVDIDAMQVGIDNGHEFYLSSCLGAPTLRIDKTSGAVPTQENPTPEVCLAQLAGSTTTTELVLQVRTGLTFCLLTNSAEAARQNIPQRLGIVEVRDLGADKSVIVAVSTYRVPT